jgi:hypothetical protein
MITHLSLNCPVPADPSQFDYLFDFNHAQHFSMPLTALNQSFIDWLQERNLSASFLEVFYLPAHCTVRRIHTDLDHITDQAAKINFIIGGEDSPMQWFKLKTGARSYLGINRAPEDVNQGVVSPYLSWSRDECEIIDQAILSGSNLIHAGIPHVVFTNTKPRVAVSVVVRDIVSRQRLTCEAVASRL